MLEYPLLIVRHHASAMMGDYLEMGILFQDTDEDKAGHGSCSFVWPAKNAGYLKLGCFFRFIISKFIFSPGMNVNRKIVVGHFFPQRPELRRIQRFSVDIGVNIDTFEP